MAARDSTNLSSQDYRMLFDWDSEGPPPPLYSAVELADVSHELANFMAEDGEMPCLQVMGPLWVPGGAKFF